jgi:Fic family protein
MAPRSGFQANYRRYTPEATKLLMQIASALGTIQGAQILPALADQLRASARAGTVHYSNLIEGNQLPLIEAERAARHQLAPDTRAKIELVNYVNALELIDERISTSSLVLTSAFFKELHGVAMRGLGRDDDAHFKPHHEGEWRDGIAVVVDRLTGQVMHEGPPPEDVPELMDAMFEWLSDKREAGQEPAFVLAGVVHYGITDVHPFADGNGRAARLLQTAVLMAAGVLPGRMFSFERYYAEDRGAYYSALRSVRKNTYNMEAWLDYFLQGLAEEYERIAATVTDLAGLVTGGDASPLRLTAGQQKALTSLRVQGRREFTRRDYEEAARVSKAVATKEISELIRHGILAARGAGPSTRYVFAAKVTAPGPRRGPGRPMKWDDARIERELRGFLDGRSAWPKQGEFQAAGRGDLYSAASRAGGLARWRRMFGR